MVSTQAGVAQVLPTNKMLIRAFGHYVCKYISCLSPFYWYAEYSQAGFEPTTFGLIVYCLVIFFRQQVFGVGDSRILSLAYQDLWYTVVPGAGEYHLWTSANL